VKRIRADGAHHTVCPFVYIINLLLILSASIVPYKAFPTADGDILLGGGNDRLYGVLCTKIGKPEYITDDRFKTNAQRVQNRDVLEGLIEEQTRQKSTQEWLDLLEGCGMRESRNNSELHFANTNSLRCDQ
jgi:crotonobetainyl-CoA:carnitine CoA-transferase CaiB-like acyl-CoA transferase